MTTAWLSSGVVQLFDWTWRTSLEASVLIVLVLLLHRAAGRWLSTRTRFVLSWLVLIRLMMPAVPSASWGLPSLTRLFAKAPYPLVLVSPTESGWVSVSQQAALRPAPLEVPAVGVDFHRAGGVSAVLGLVWAAGGALSLLIVIWEHRKLGRWVRRQGRAADPALLASLDSCRRMMGVSRRVEVIVVEEGATPVLFGWRKPQLLIPRSALRGLTGSELRFVLLHELAHVRRHDILLNWAMILLQSWHWFNPLVRLSMRQLRADRELICDAMVLKRLSRTEQRLYGQTLLKLLEMVTSPRLSAGVVPVINTKHELKNRISMISLFKPSRPAAWVLTIAAAAVVCCLTFTQAADQTTKPAPIENTPAKVEASLQPERGNARSAVQVLEDQLQRQEKRVQAAQQEVNALRRNLASGDDGADPKTDGDGVVEDVRALDRERISIEARMAQSKSLLQQIEARSQSQIRQMLPTAMPDELLRGLLERLSIAQTEMVRLSAEFGPEDVRMKSAGAAIRDLNKQIDERVEGILAGLKAQVASQQSTLLALKERTALLQEEDAKRVERYRPYFAAKQELDRQQRIRETLMLRLLQETIDAQIPKH